jgi:hypothetical protein
MSLPLRTALLATALATLQLGVVQLSPSGLAVRIVLPLTLAAAFVVLWPYRRYLAVWVIYVGLAANLAAILANGGLMPIERSTVVAAAGEARAADFADGAWIERSKDVLVAPGSGRAVALGDSIIIRVGGGGFVASPGDLVIFAGLLVLAAEATAAWHRRRRQATAPIPHPPALPAVKAGGGTPTPQ